MGAPSAPRRARSISGRLPCTGRGGGVSYKAAALHVLGERETEGGGALRDCGVDARVPVLASGCARAGGLGRGSGHGLLQGRQGTCLLQAVRGSGLEGRRALRIHLRDDARRSGVRSIAGRCRAVRGRTSAGDGFPPGHAAARASRYRVFSFALSTPAPKRRLLTRAAGY